MDLKQKLLQVEDENIQLRLELKQLYEELEYKNKDYQILEENQQLKNELLQMNNKLQFYEQQKQELTLKLIDQQEVNIHLNKQLQELKVNVKENNIQEGNQKFYNQNQCFQDGSYKQQLQILRQRYFNKTEQISQQKEYEIERLYQQLSELQKQNNNSRTTKYSMNENLQKSQYKQRGISEKKMSNLEYHMVESRIFR